MDDAILHKAITYTGITLTLFLMFWRFACRYSDREGRRLKKERFTLYELQQDEYMFRCLRLGLIEPADDEDEAVKEMTDKQFEQFLRLYRKGGGLAEYADEKYKEYEKKNNQFKRKRKGEADNVFYL